MIGFDKYKTTAATTASTENQLIFIFDESIKLLHTTKKAIEKRDHETKYKSLTKIIDSFYILRSGIDKNLDKEEFKTIDNFYYFTIRGLEEINMKDGPADEIDIFIESFSQVRSSISSTMKEQSKARTQEKSQKAPEQTLKTANIKV